jgi:hypothetical protein
MTTSFKGSTTKEDIYNFIDKIKVSEGSSLIK